MNFFKELNSHSLKENQNGNVNDKYVGKSIIRHNTDIVNEGKI